MQFILKDSYIHIVNNSGIANNNIEADVILEYVNDIKKKKFEYAVNGSPFKPIEDKKILIQKDELKKPYIDLEIRAIGPKGVQTFKAERTPLTYAVIFGKSIEEAYPAKIHQLEEKLDRFIKTAENILSYVEELEKKGRLL